MDYIINRLIRLISNPCIFRHVLLVMQNMESPDVHVWKRIFVCHSELLAANCLKSGKIFKLRKMNDTGNL